MGSSATLISIASHRRRRLAAVMLRGDLAAYDATPLFRAKVDRLIDELLASHDRPQSPDSWDAIADRVIERFGHRVREARVAESVVVAVAPIEASVPIHHTALSFSYV
jgi:hypothetical protein